ncbi:MAG: fibronectin type III domain-containing protein [Nitrospinae bacterium]|nr:fibronectin type III domain-containing protein [Nitrospinota bacterium]
MESARHLKTQNMKTNKYSLFLSLLFLFCFFHQISSPSPAFSQTSTLALFEAKEYVKPKGAPVTYTDTIQVTPGDYILWVYNGPGSGFGGFGEVKNVSVSINGIVVIDSSDLRKSNPVTKTISLQSNNTVKVVLKGQGDNSILLGISPPPVTAAITSPADGAVLNSSPVTVEGTVSSNANVTVNGIQANVSNNTFSASVPLIEGINTITAVARDQYSTTYRSITVTLLTKGSIAGIVTDSSTGLPLSSATVSVTDSLNITQTAVTDSNPKTNYTITSIASGDFTGSIAKDGYTSYSFTGTITPGRTITINASLSPIYPSISNITVSNITADSATISWTTDQISDSLVEYGATTSYGSSISDTALTTNHSILLTNLIFGATYHFRITSKNSYGFASTSGDNTFSITDLGSYLKEKWEGMKTALVSGDIETALTYFVDASIDKYRQIFTELGSDTINSIFSSVTEFKLYTTYGRLAGCGAIRVEAGGTYSYPVTFILDENGIWKILGL